MSDGSHWCCKDVTGEVVFDYENLWALNLFSCLNMPDWNLPPF